MAILRASKNESGFTLVEVMVVMAITSALVVIAFIGQRELRSRAQFDASIEKIVSTVSSAQTQAVAGVNIKGAGDGLAASRCPTGPPPNPPTSEVVFAGTSWTVDASSGGNTAFTIDFYKAMPDQQGTPNSAACVFDSQAIGLPAGIQISAPAAYANKVSGMLFVRTSSGGLDICPAAPAGALPAFRNATRGSFENASCVNGFLTLTLKDTDGHTADIRIDTSGLARRLN